MSVSDREPSTEMTSIELTGLIGFDIRPCRKLSVIWTEERRSLFLLRDDIQQPLSVDQTVWPSCFPDSGGEQWRGVLGHWSKLDAMADAGARQGIDQTVSRFIATVIVLEWVSDDERTQWLSKRLDETLPACLGPEWRPLGYDVADQWLTSGLSNCGYVGNERDEWRSRWGDRVNEVHLFDDPSEASAFAIATNERVPEHAPFFVYSLLERVMNTK
jgi:hypothetical protein